MSDVNGWNQWSKHVLLELERLNACYETASKSIEKMSNSTAVMTSEYKGLSERLTSLIAEEGTHYSRLKGDLEKIRMCLKTETLLKKDHEAMEKGKNNAVKWAIGLIPPYLGLIITIIVLISRLP